MSWVADNSLNFVQQFCVNVIKCGRIPRHIAFIMDGNRRYARKTNVQKAEGHIRGFDKLSETLHWCKQLGITEVTVYAFSIENFNRSRDEVDMLMSLAKEKFQKLLDDEKLMKDGVCIRVFGVLDLLPIDLRRLIAKTMLLTRYNNKLILNIAFAYTSRDEITTAVQEVLYGVRDAYLDVEDIDEMLLNECLFTNRSPVPDVIVRTSGEVRFSDFMLWQIGKSVVFFSDLYWPEFNIWHLLVVVFKYQRAYRHEVIQGGTEINGIKSGRVVAFLEKLDESRWKRLEIFAAS